MIAIHSIEDLIREHPLFARSGPAVAALLASCARNVVFRDGALIMREGEPADQFLLVREGRVALETSVPGRGSVVTQTVKSGEALGLSWLVPPYLSDFDARAVGTVRALEFDVGCLRDKCDSDPQIGYAFYKLLVPTLVGRLRTARIQALDLYASVTGPSPG